MADYRQLRKDGRDWNQLRPLLVELNLLQRSDGSAKVSMGATSVVAGVTGPVESKMNQQSIEILIRPSNGVPQEKHRLIEAQIARILQQVISIPHGCTVSIFCEILIDDGSVPAVLLNAISLALISAGVSMSRTLLAISHAHLRQEDRVTPQLVLDASLAEETLCGEAPTTIFDAISGKILGLIGNTKSPSVFQSLAVSSSAIGEILEIVRSAFKSHLAPLTNPRRG